MTTVTMYTSSTCGYCSAAKKLLAEKGVKPVEISVDADRSRFTEMMAKTGRRTVPQIYIGDLHVGGFDELYTLHSQGKLDSML
jgi:glutaredoxin 3